jgi:predicted MFS family arabinose efflux permease
MSKPVDNPHLWITKRLPAAVISRAISLVFSGNSIAAIVAVPLGSYLGGVYGWRVIYLLAAVFGIITLALQSGSARLSGRRPEGELPAALGRLKILPALGALTRQYPAMHRRCRPRRRRAR